MEKYIIYFYQTSSKREVIKEFIERLDTKTGAKVKNGINLMRLYGLNLINTPWIKKIHKKYSLFELRIKSEFSVRLLFFFLKPNKFVIVHIFIKKSNKLPPKELKLAINRVKEFI